MIKILTSIFFITFAHQAIATTIDAELAKPKAYEYETIDYSFNLLKKSLSSDFMLLVNSLLVNPLL